MKIAKTIPLFKKGDITEVSNHRPISILPVISKIFEECIHDRFLDFSTRNNVQSGDQFDFLAGRSFHDIKIKESALGNFFFCCNFLTELCAAFAKE